MLTLEENMTIPDVLPKKSRSESMKDYWNEKKTKQKEQPMKADVPIKAWVYHSEWFALMATLVGCFIFVHHEAVHVNERLDQHITDINRRADLISIETNKRCDELHKEFYDLLKEMNKKDRQ